jgi:hypothetical protein
VIRRLIGVMVIVTGIRYLWSAWTDDSLRPLSWYRTLGKRSASTSV